MKATVILDGVREERELFLPYCSKFKEFDLPGLITEDGPEEEQWDTVFDYLAIIAFKRMAARWGK